MPHDPTTVKLRPGAANPKYVKLYPWTSAGALTITETDSGAGTEAVYVDRIFDIVDAGAGSEVVQALITKTILIVDAGAGSEVIVAHIIGREEIKTPQTVLRLFNFSHKQLKDLEAEIRVFSRVHREGYLSMGGDPHRLQYIETDYGQDYAVTGRVDLTDDHPIIPRNKGIGSTPSGWLQGGKSKRIDLYTLGRITILDTYLDEAGDSREIPELELHFLDLQGRHANIYAKNAQIEGANVAFKDRDRTVYRYRIKVEYMSDIADMSILKMTVKPISSPLTVTITHPTIHGPSSEWEVFINEQLEIKEAAISSFVEIDAGEQNETKATLESADYEAEAALGSGTLETETEIEVTVK